MKTDKMFQYTVLFNFKIYNFLKLYFLVSFILRSSNTLITFLWNKKGSKIDLLVDKFKIYLNHFYLYFYYKCANNNSRKNIS